MSYPDEVRAWAKSSEWKDLKPLFEDLSAVHGHERIEISQRQAAASGAKAVNPFKRGRVKASAIPDDTPPMDRWWFGMYPGCLTYVCGETGAGKSSWLYNLMIHAARNEPLWGIPFGARRPLKVLYLDPENSGNFDNGIYGVCNDKLKRIGQGKPDLLEFHDGEGINLSRDLDSLEQVIVEENFDAVVCDPITNLYGTKDENDNAEAAAQFTALKGLVKRTMVNIVAIHHTGRDGSGIFGRGATARLGAADVGIIMRVRGEQEEVDDDFGEGQLIDRTDVVRLQMVKNRLEPGKASIYLRMMGQDRFERVKFEDWKAAANASNGGAKTQEERAKQEIQILLADGMWHTRANIVEGMRKESIGQVNTDRALEALELNNVIISQRKGRGGSMAFILAAAHQKDENGSFVLLHSSKETTKLQNFGEPEKEEFEGPHTATDKFFDEKPRSPYKDNDDDSDVL